LDVQIEHVPRELLGFLESVEFAHEVKVEDALPLKE
jgi:hypothetical protein